METLKDLLSSALDSDKAVKLTLEMPSHDAVFADLTNYVNNTVETHTQTKD